MALPEHRLARFGVSMEETLLKKFDQLIEKKGYKNRSEAVRDLVREALVRQTWEEDDQIVAGSILIFYDHHHRNLIEELTKIQHHRHRQIQATTHFHLDDHNCLELIVVKGKAKEIQELCDSLCSLKGVKYGKLTVSPVQNV
jgi:CopG family nickel-responsive transcriptional regulator